MDSSFTLETLKQRVPRFTSWPNVRMGRIGGDEFELGHQDENGEPEAEFHRLPIIMENGGEVDQDGNHAEACAPETRDVVRRTAYGEAMKQICFRERFAHKLYCHCVDGYGTPFGGSHESYFTYAKRNTWPRLIPFLIARTLIAGTGNWIQKGETPVYEISQRARFIQTDVSNNTTCNRGIINTRDDPLSAVPGWDRMHIIYSEPTMCEVATFLRFGLLSLVIEMLEMDALPHVVYDQEKSVSDLHRLSGQMHGWFLEGVTRGPKGAVELLGCYVERAKELFGRRDEVTDAVIVIAEDTLQKLASHPMRLLFGRLDWVTKFAALISVLEEFPDPVPDRTGWLQNQDMEWHNLNPDEGLYYALRQTRQVERIVSDDLIEEAMKEPPTNTRAFVRGKTQQLLNREGKGRELRCGLWNCISVVDASFNRGERKSGRDGGPAHEYWSEPIPNPFDPGHELLQNIKAKIAR